MVLTKLEHANKYLESITTDEKTYKMFIKLTQKTLLSITPEEQKEFKETDRNTFYYINALALYLKAIINTDKKKRELLYKRSYEDFLKIKNPSRKVKEFIIIAGKNYACSCELNLSAVKTLIEVFNYYIKSKIGDVDLALIENRMFPKKTINKNKPVKVTLIRLITYYNSVITSNTYLNKTSMYAEQGPILEKLDPRDEKDAVKRGEIESVLSADAEKYDELINKSIESSIYYLELLPNRELKDETNLYDCYLNMISIHGANEENPYYDIMYANVKPKMIYEIITEKLKTHDQFNSIIDYIQMFYMNIYELDNENNHMAICGLFMSMIYSCENAFPVLRRVIDLFRSRENTKLVKICSALLLEKNKNIESVLRAIYKLGNRQWLIDYGKIHDKRFIPIINKITNGNTQKGKKLLNNNKSINIARKNKSFHKSKKQIKKDKDRKEKLNRIKKQKELKKLPFIGPLRMPKQEQLVV